MTASQSSNRGIRLLSTRKPPKRKCSPHWSSPVPQLINNKPSCQNGIPSPPSNNAKTSNRTSRLIWRMEPNQQERLVRSSHLLPLTERVGNPHSRLSSVRHPWRLVRARKAPQISRCCRRRKVRRKKTHWKVIISTKISKALNRKCRLKKQYKRRRSAKLRPANLYPVATRAHRRLSPPSH